MCFRINFMVHGSFVTFCLGKTFKILTSLLKVTFLHNIRYTGDCSVWSVQPYNMHFNYNFSRHCFIFSQCFDLVFTRQCEHLQKISLHTDYTVWLEFEYSVCKMLIPTNVLIVTWWLNNIVALSSYKCRIGFNYLQEENLSQPDLCTRCRIWS